MKLIIYPLLIILFCGASSEKKQSNEAEGLPQQELSLQKDREYLNQLRKDVPEDVKKDNDDLAYILKLFEDKRRDPNKIRRKFDETIRRVRKKRTKEFKRLRDNFNKKEKKDRKEFLKKLKKERNEAMEKKLPRDEMKEFYDNQRAQRKEYFADQRDRRKDFESELKSQRKDFDDYIKDKRKQFDDHYRAFKKEQREQKKRETMMRKRNGHSAPKTSKLPDEHQEYLKDFNKIPDKRGIPLKPEKEE